MTGQVVKSKTPADDESPAQFKAEGRTAGVQLYELLGICLVKFFNFLGFMGVVFIVYGSVASETNETWGTLERIAEPLAAGLTVLATLLTALSIYVYSHVVRPPARFSRAVSAPLVIAACVVALVALSLNRSLPVLVVNGFALLAIAGALFRMSPFEGEP